MNFDKFSSILLNNCWSLCYDNILVKKINFTSINYSHWNSDYLECYYSLEGIGKIENNNNENLEMDIFREFFKRSKKNGKLISERYNINFQIKSIDISTVSLDSFKICLFLYSFEEIKELKKIKQISRFEILDI